MNKYIAPGYGKQSFHCPACGVLSRQWWGAVWLGTNWVQFKAESDKISCSACESCSNITIWRYDGKQVTLIYPLQFTAPAPHDFLPEELLPLYLEAARIQAHSPRSAAALLRVLLLRLMPYLDQPKGQRLDKSINELAKKGLPDEIKDILKICRVIGGHAVEPGRIAFEEECSSVQALFEAANFLAAEFIAKPQRLKNSGQVAHMFGAEPGERSKTAGFH